VKQRLLIIDDDDAFRTVLRESLSKSGYEIKEAASGRQAQEVMKKFIPDLVLLDVMMPDIDGVSLCREIRGNPAMQDVPVLILSALGDSQTVNDALLFGATDYVVKPIDLGAIAAKVDKALRQAETRRRAR
jgi:two-component system, OmpR family, alkaline phosphatase synthesis response regulator PhoP